MTARITVLVVEDEPLIRLTIADQLADFDFYVLEASNADQAIDILRFRRDIQVVFTDIDMPGSMDGLKLAAAVRDRWPPIKLIVTSGHHKISADALPTGSRFFSKPYRAEAVAQAAREMLA